MGKAEGDWPGTESSPQIETSVSGGNLLLKCWPGLWAPGPPLPSKACGAHTFAATRKLPGSGASHTSTVGAPAGPYQIK